MKRKFKTLISIFMGILILCTLGIYASAETSVDKSKSKVHKNEITKGVNNLNNAANNSAKVDDILRYPEKGWNRYDDTNSLIQYTADKVEWSEGYSEIGDDIDKTFYDSTISSQLGYSSYSVKFRINGSKFRIIGRLYKLAQSDITQYNPTKNIELLIDGKKVDDFGTFCSSDISESFYVQQVLLYEYSFNSVGIHDVEIKLPRVQGKWVDQMGLDAIDTDGQLVNATTPTTQLKPVLNVETPEIGKIYTGTIPVSGYALNPSGVKAVKIYLDDKYSKDATIGGARTDVAQKYQGYPGASTSGFSTSYNLNEFIVGDHIMKVQAIGNDGSIQEVILYLYVYENKVIIKNTPIVNKAPLHRYTNSDGTQHFYTTNYNELKEGALGYTYEGIECYVYPTQQTGTVPLYRYGNSDGSSHFYTTSNTELKEGQLGYKYEGIQCYVYSTKQNGTVALHRYTNSDGTSHFYTTNYNELKEGALGYKYEGVQCYVFPKDTNK